MMNKRSEGEQEGSEGRGLPVAASGMTLEQAVGLLNEYSHRNSSWWIEAYSDHTARFVRGADPEEHLTAFEAIAVARLYLRIKEEIGLDRKLAAGFQFAKHPIT